jgi:hypothetical protein
VNVAVPWHVAPAKKSNLRDPDGSSPPETVAVASRAVPKVDPLAASEIARVALVTVSEPGDTVSW